MRRKTGLLALLAGVTLSFTFLTGFSDPDIMINIEGNENDYKIDIVDKRAIIQDGNLTQEELDELIRLQSKLLTGEDNTGKDSVTKDLGEGSKIEVDLNKPDESVIPTEPEEAEYEPSSNAKGSPVFKPENSSEAVLDSNLNNFGDTQEAMGRMIQAMKPLFSLAFGSMLFLLAIGFMTKFLGMVIEREKEKNKSDRK